MNRAVVVLGLAFGDEGKGTMTDYFTRLYGAELVVRHGGPQAAHNVVTESGERFTFAQFGSGTLAGAKTFLSEYMLVDPLALEMEALQLRTLLRFDPFKLLSVDPKCVIVTPWQKLANQIRETVRGNKRHGSVGRGIGETRQDDIDGYRFTVGDLEELSYGKLCEIRNHKIVQMMEYRDQAPELYRKLVNTDASNVLSQIRDCLAPVQLMEWDEAASLSEVVVFEGSQGVLLDEVHGFAPYNTWLDCTAKTPNLLVGDVDCLRVGVLRSYFTRHGAGPFPTEQPTMNWSEPHNKHSPYMGSFRVGDFDGVLAEYAIKHAGQLNCIALTHADREMSIVCHDYDSWDGQFTAESLLKVTTPRYRFSGIRHFIETTTEIPVGFTSHGPTAQDKISHHSISASKFKIGVGK